MNWDHNDHYDHMMKIINSPNATMHERLESVPFRNLHQNMCLCIGDGLDSG